MTTSPGGGLNDAGLHKRIGLIHRECEEIGHRANGIELTVYSDLTGADLLSDRIEELIALGVDRVAIDNLLLTSDQLCSLTNTLAKRFTLLG